MRLEPGEQLLWSGRPRSRLTWVDGAAALGVVAGTLGVSWHQMRADWIVALLALVAAIARVYFLANTFWGVTDRRIIKVTGAGATSYPLAHIESASINRDKTGGGIVTFLVRRPGRRTKISFSIERDAQRVYDLIDSRISAR